MDKTGAFDNIVRMMKIGGRIVIRNPLGKAFIKKLKRNAPYPLDEFPDKPEADNLSHPFGFKIQNFIDEPELFILAAIKSDM